MRQHLLAADQFLRAGGARGEVWDRLSPARVVGLICATSAVYGGVMASFGGVFGDRAWMVLYGAVKVPMLFGVTMLLAVPSFYVLNVLAGVGEDFRRVWRGLVDYQLAVGLQLASLVPTTVLVNLSTLDYRIAQVWSTLLFAGVAWNARRSLAVFYEPLIARSPVHARLRTVWFVVYAFIGVQMGWDLRPFVGNPGLEVQFFRDEIGNAYVEIFRIFVEAL